MAGIRTYEDRWGKTSRAVIAASKPSSCGDRTLPNAVIRRLPPVIARVEHGRWIADCPTLGCVGAEFVSFDVPVFFCCECRNAEVGHDLLAVVVPKSDIRLRIEEVLLARPVPSTRNWYPGETLDDLREQNREHGINPLPKD